jgi:long-chain acyl-CoA synthetase
MNLAVLAEQNLERYGTYESVIFDDRPVTNAEQLEGAHRFANALQRLGVKPGERVAVMLPNCVEVYQAYTGITAMGGVVVPIVFLLAVPEIHHILADCMPKAIVTGMDFLAAVRMAVGGLAEPPTVIVAGPAGSSASADQPEGTLSLDALLAGESPEFTPVDRDDEDVAVIMYTGGTTGRAKGVMVTHGSLLWMAQTLAEDSDVTPQDVGLMALPVSHLFGMISGITGQVLGTRGVLLRWFSPEDVLRSIDRHRVTFIPMVPTMALLLMQHSEAATFDTSSLKTVLLSAAPVPLELKEGFARMFGCEVLEGYGQTEASPAIALERRGEEHRPGSTGRAVRGVEVAILDAGGEPLPSSEVGEICARSPGMMKGYYNAPDATSDALRDGWLHTGDMGWMDLDGYLYVTDRKKDLIIRGGFNVFPRDIEEVLYEHPGVAEAAVVGKPDPAMGEEVVAFVVPASGSEPPTEEDLLAFCRQRLATYKSPKEIRFVRYLPKSPIGKILKKDLREQLAQG